jgi:hypothetical protein
LKGSSGSGEQHEVVGDDAQDEFALLCLVSNRRLAPTLRRGFLMVRCRG